MRIFINILLLLGINVLLFAKDQQGKLLTDGYFKPWQSVKRKNMKVYVTGGGFGIVKFANGVLFNIAPRFYYNSKGDNKTKGRILAPSNCWKTISGNMEKVENSDIFNVKATLSCGLQKDVLMRVEEDSVYSKTTLSSISLFVPGKAFRFTGILNRGRLKKMPFLAENKRGEKFKGDLCKWEKNLPNIVSLKIQINNIVAQFEFDDINKVELTPQKDSSCVAVIKWEPRYPIDNFTIDKEFTCSIKLILKTGSLEISNNNE